MCAVEREMRNVCLEEQQNVRDVPVVFRCPALNKRLELTQAVRGMWCMMLLDSWKLPEMIKTEKRVDSCRNAALAIPAMQTDGQPEVCAHNFSISLVRLLRSPRRKLRKKDGRMERRRIQRSLHERNKYEMQYHSPVLCPARSSPEFFCTSFQTF